MINPSKWSCLVEQGTEAARSELKIRLREIILDALDARATSKSNVSGVTITGNKYQTIKLGDEIIPGFREDRTDLYYGLALEGRSACDLGSNLGENARDLARQGASYVDAYEYDRFFTDLARLISVYNDIPNVTHLSTDLSKRHSLKGRYDFCSALAVYAYIEPIVDYICSKVGDSLIVETHEVDEHWYERYVLKISAHLPHWGCFGIIKHGDTERVNKRRLRLIFSRSPLDDFFVRRNRQLSAEEIYSHVLDVSGSHIPALSEAQICLTGALEFRQSEQGMERFKRRLRQYEARARSHGDVELSLSGEAYWLAFIVGLKEFERNGLDDNNAYSKWLKSGLERGIGDPGLVHLLQQEGRFEEMVGRRLRYFAEIIDDPQGLGQGEALIIYNPVPSHTSLDESSSIRIKEARSGLTYNVAAVDGHHRIFMAQYLGVETLNANFFWDPSFNRFGPEDVLGRNYSERAVQFLGGKPIDDPVF